jgi:hypothetical protein
MPGSPSTTATCRGPGAVRSPKYRVQRILARPERAVTTECDVTAQNAPTAECAPNADSSGQRTFRPTRTSNPAQRAPSPRITHPPRKVTSLHRMRPPRNVESSYRVQSPARVHPPRILLADELDPSLALSRGQLAQVFGIDHCSVGPAGLEPFQQLHMDRMFRIRPQGGPVVVLGHEDHVVGSRTTVAVTADLEALQGRNPTRQASEPHHRRIHLLSVSQSEHHDMCNHTDRLVPIQVGAELQS